MTEKKRTYNTDSPYWLGLRHESDAPKSEGFFGRIPVPGGQGVATEFSADVDINGKPVQIPTIVPTLNGSELSAVLRAAGGQPGADVPDAAMGKAIDHARARMAMGQSPFWRIPERQAAIPRQGLVDVADDALSQDMSRLYVDALRRKAR